MSAWSKVHHQVVIINNEVTSFRDDPVPVAPLKAIFPVGSHLIAGGYSEWKRSLCSAGLQGMEPSPAVLPAKSQLPPPQAAGTCLDLPWGKGQKEWGQQP